MRGLLVFVIGVAITGRGRGYGFVYGLEIVG